MVERCRSLEALGFDCLWMGDILLSPIERNLPWFGAWTALAGLATQTARIRLGTLITTFAVRHPVLLAKDALTVDHISNGRLEVGLGAGGYEDRREAKMLGRVIPDAPGRVRRFREGVELVDRLLRGEVTTYRGRFFQVHEAIARPTPVQRPRPPLTIAAHGRVTLKIAATYADSWNTFMGTRIGQTGAEVVEIIRTRNALLNEYAAARGRARGDIIRSFLAGWTTDTP
jgi:alkanesulfonate monooxygenase SsuD/methylene tetrahydromethanopterin reductase-like flavin-dependent oxidoreductase (luciferase family)